MDHELLTLFPLGQECNAGRGRVAKAAVRGSGAAPRHRLPVVQERGARPRGAGQSQERGICAFTQFTFPKCLFKTGEDIYLLSIGWLPF
jgi:hypothetical protein